MRNALNSIRFFGLPSGEMISDPSTMRAMAIAHFQHLLAPQSPVASISSPLWFQPLSDFRCPEDISTAMILFPSEEEIRNIIFKFNPNKPPEPDGLTSGFYKAAWKILGSEVIYGVKNFFATGFLPFSVNATILTLVPKRIGASSVADYRPISCNTLYKAISKLLVKLLKPLLP